MVEDESGSLDKIPSIPEADEGVVDDVVCSDRIEKGKGKYKEGYE